MFAGIPFLYALSFVFHFTWTANGAATSSIGGLKLEARKGFSIPLSSTRVKRPQRGRKSRRGDVTGSIGTGNNADLLYTVPIELGESVFAVNVDTGSSDLWVVSDKCKKDACKGSTVSRYPTSSLVATGTDVDMIYGDSKTGTHASGTIGLETATVAGVAMTEQPFGLVNDTTNTVVEFDVAGIFGLGFPSGSLIQQALVVDESDSISQSDDFVNSTSTSGPLLARMASTGALEMPMFSIMLQRDTIDISGQGMLTVGDLPDGVDNSSLTWVPVRLYNAAEGGLPPPSYAPDEVYPYRWEIDIEGVFLDGNQLPASSIASNGLNSSRVSALIDTGNSILRGPEDTVNSILSTVSPLYDPAAQAPVATLPCNVPRTLSFQIGGKLFPIDPRDFIGQFQAGDAVTCQADNLVSTDPPGVGALYSWSLGTPFFRSNLVAFHYGNLTHPSVDPPRIGIMSNVPANAGQLLQDAVKDAVRNGGNFPDIIKDAPTASAATAPQVTISAIPSLVALPVSSTATTDPFSSPVPLTIAGPFAGVGGASAPTLQTSTLHVSPTGTAGSGSSQKDNTSDAAGQVQHLSLSTFSIVSLFLGYMLFC